MYDFYFFGLHRDVNAVACVVANEHYTYLSPMTLRSKLPVRTKM